MIYSRTSHPEAQAPHIMGVKLILATRVGHEKFGRALLYVLLFVLFCILCCKQEEKERIRYSFS